MTDQIVEKVARAIDPTAWAFIDKMRAEQPDHKALPITVEAQLRQARAAIEAYEAARREVEGQKRTCGPEIFDAALKSLAEQYDAPPPPAPFVTDHKWLDPECHASGCQTLILKAKLEKLRDQRDKYMWQVRDTCARAEAAEADAKRLREALRLIDALDPEDAIRGFSQDAARGAVLRMGELARAALAQGGNDDQGK